MKRENVSHPIGAKNQSFDFSKALTHKMRMPLTDKYLGPVEFTDDVTLLGMVDGDATISAGATLTLGGMISGNLTVSEGAAALILGMVRGLVINLGGKVEIYGMAGGIHNAVGATTFVDESAIISGNPTL